MENDQNAELEPIQNEEMEVNEESKPELTPEQELGLKKRRFSKLAKELGIELPKPEPAKIEKKEEKKDFDYGELSFLEVKGIPEEDHAFILQEIQETGKPLKAIVSFNYVKEELKKRSEARKTKEAMPEGTKRSSGSVRSDVDRYVQTGENPSDPALLREVVKARRKQAENTARFTDVSVVSPEK